MAKGKKGKKSGSSNKAGILNKNDAITVDPNLVNGEDASSFHTEQDLAVSDTETKEVETLGESTGNSHTETEANIDDAKEFTGKFDAAPNLESEVGSSTDGSNLIAFSNEQLQSVSADAENSILNSQSTELQETAEEGFASDDKKVSDDVIDEDEDDDFGSFDEASFEEPEAVSGTNIEDVSTSSDFLERHQPNVSEILDFIFPSSGVTKSTEAGPLLSEEAESKFRQLSKLPHLQPPNWKKSNLRYKLFLKLGIPINLDELNSSSSFGGSRSGAQAKKSLSEKDLDWSKFNLPDIESFNLTEETRQKYIQNTTEILSRVEKENMENISELHLQKSSPKELDEKLAQIRANFDQLLMLGSLWHEKLDDLKASQNVYESVVQSMVGYNQKIQRNELLENLRRSKTKRGKKTF